MRNLLTGTVLLAFTLLPSYGFASPLSQQLEEAEALLTSQDPAAAFDKLDSIVETFWQHSPMIVRKAAFVSEISGYGSFKVKDPVFKPDESQMIYLEPVAFSYGKTSEGGAIASWSVDYSLTGKGDAVLFDKKDFVQLSVPLTKHNREIHLKMIINLTGMKPGDYTSHYVLKDANSDKTAQFSLPFTIVE